MKKVKESTYETCAKQIGCEKEALKAIVQVETGGRGGFVMEGMPYILFEGHIFWQRLKKKGKDPKDYVVGNEDILYSSWTKDFYKGGLAEYERLEKAKRIDEEAALESASWGMFQVMGFNYKSVGFNNVKEFVEAMRKSEDEQINAAAKFIINNKQMRDALIKKDWKTFARLYNGPKYYENKYDEKMALAYDHLKNL